MNSVQLIGNLTRDPEVMHTQSNMAVCKFTIAINRLKDGTDFPKIICFGNLAENCGKYLEKGRKVGVEGRLQTGSYTDKDGRKVYTTDVIADRVEFLNGVSMPKEEDIPEQFAQAAADLPW